MVLSESLRKTRWKYFSWLGFLGVTLLPENTEKSRFFLKQRNGVVITHFLKRIIHFWGDVQGFLSTPGDTFALLLELCSSCLQRICFPWFWDLPSVGSRVPPPAPSVQGGPGRDWSSLHLASGCPLARMWASRGQGEALSSRLHPLGVWHSACHVAMPINAYGAECTKPVSRHKQFTPKE